jgi:hypothetical protein
VAPKPKLAPEAAAELMRRLASCASLETAANAAGVAERTAQRWLARGRELRARQDADGRVHARAVEHLMPAAVEVRGLDIGEACPLEKPAKGIEIEDRDA